MITRIRMCAVDSELSQLASSYILPIRIVGSRRLYGTVLLYPPETVSRLYSKRLKNSTFSPDLQLFLGRK